MLSGLLPERANETNRVGTPRPARRRRPDQIGGRHGIHTQLWSERLMAGARHSPTNERRSRPSQHDAQVAPRQQRRQKARVGIGPASHGCLDLRPSGRLLRDFARGPDSAGRLQCGLRVSQDSSFDSSINDGTLCRTRRSAGAVVMAQYLLHAIEHELTRVIFQPARPDRGVLYRQILTD